MSLTSNEEKEKQSIEREGIKNYTSYISSKSLSVASLLEKNVWFSLYHICCTILCLSSVFVTIIKYWIVVSSWSCLYREESIEGLTYHETYQSDYSKIFIWLQNIDEKILICRIVGSCHSNQTIHRSSTNMIYAWLSFDTTANREFHPILCKSASLFIYAISICLVQSIATPNNTIYRKRCLCKLLSWIIYSP